MIPLNRAPAIPVLPKQSGLANVPGLRRLWLVEARHVLGVDDPRKVPGFVQSNWLLAPTALQLTEDAVLTTLKFRAERGDYEQKVAVGVQGVSYQQALTLSVPKDHGQTTLFVQRMSGRKWIAIYEDANGLRKVVGSNKQPLRFVATLKTSPNGWAFSWLGETRQPAAGFNDDGLFVASDADYSTEFSFGFSYDFFS